MRLEVLAEKVENKGLLKRRQTAAAIGARIGYKALGYLTAEGRAVKYQGRPPEYTKVG